jgi:type I restriction enzyme, S subunit
MSEEVLPRGWAWTTLGALAADDGVFVDGDWVETKDQDPAGDVRLTQLADVGDGTWRDRSNRFLTRERAAELRCTFLKRDDVLIARMPDPLGRACLFPGSERECVTVVDVAILRPGLGSVEPRWLMHAINSPSMRGAISAQQSGTTRKRISRTNLGGLAIPVPPLPEQCRIVEELERRLSHVDAAERSLEGAKRKLESARRSIFHAVVDGSLVADCGGRSYASICQHAGVPFDVIPERPGWVRARIGAIATVGSGSTPNRGNKRYWENGDVPWVTSGQIVGGEYIREPAELITALALKETSVKLWPAGTLLVAMYGEGKTRGHCAELTIESTCNQACAAITLTAAFASVKPLLKFIFEARYEENRALSSGGVQDNLNLGLIKNMTVDLPPREMQHELVTEAARRLSLLEAAATSIELCERQCARLRLALLGAAFAGRLVPQIPGEEPADELLRRIRGSGEIEPRSTNTKPRGRRKREAA